MNEYNQNKRNQKYGFWAMIVGVWLLIFAGDGSSEISMILFSFGMIIITLTGIIVLKSTRNLKRLQSTQEKEID